MKVSLHPAQASANALPGHVPFGPSLVSILCIHSGLLNITAFAALHLTLTVPLAPGSRPPWDAGSRRFGSRLCDRLLREGATLSRRLRTPLAEASPSHQRRTLR